MELIIIIILLSLVFCYLFNNYNIENYSQTNYEQIPNYATYPQSLGNAYILNYQYLYPKKVTSISDPKSCLL